MPAAMALFRLGPDRFELTRLFAYYAGNNDDLQKAAEARLREWLARPTPKDLPGLRAGHYLCFFGMHVLTLLVAEARRRGVDTLFGNLPMFHAIAGTKRLHRMLAAGSSGAEIIAAWQGEVAQFKMQRARYLLY